MPTTKNFLLRNLRKAEAKYCPAFPFAPHAEEEDNSGIQPTSFLF